MARTDKGIDLQALPQEVVQAYLKFPQRNEFLPIRSEGGALDVWVLKERAWPLADHLAWALGQEVRTNLVKEREFYPLMEQALSLWEMEHEEEGPVEDDLDEEVSGNELLGWSHGDAPIVRLVNKTLQQAITRSASDIHFEGQDDKFLIRFRLDGELHNVRRLEKPIQPTVIARIKVMGDMDVAETRAPQDGRINVRVGQKEVDVRVSTIPTMNGEKAVLRILDRSKNILSLPDLGFDGATLKHFRQVINQPHGIVLVTGPTGSGKTTTLYAGLSEIVSEEKNIMTVEDPVEYHLAGVNQVQVNRPAGVTFAKTIRSFLRQDPDVILVGEIRDQETASTAIQASLTGHLVLSTLHTNDAATAVTRLLEMGTEPFLVASSLSLAMAQRLVRVNCPACSKDADIASSSLELLGHDAFTGTVQKKGEGCEECLYTGFKGRRCITEIMPISEEVRAMVIQKASADQLRALASRQGYKTMLEHGLELVGQGVTTVEEVMRVTRM